MFRVLSCLHDEHDWRLLVLAIVVCFVTSVVAITLLHRARSTHGHARGVWIVAAGTAGGCGIWAMHFIAMLAYEPGLPVAYDVPLTVLSFVAAVVLTSAGMAVTVLGARQWRALCGGIVIGLAVASMHFLGMWALQVPGRVTWSADLVAASIVLGTLFGIAAMDVAMRRQDVPMTLLASVALTVAILLLHFTAMGAIEIVPDPARIVTPFSIAPSMLALGVAAATTVVLAIGATCSIFDQRISEKTDQLDAALQNMSQGLCMLNGNFEVEVVNGRFLEMFGIPRRQVAPRMPMVDLMDLAEVAVPFGGETRAVMRQRSRALARDKRSGETAVQRSDGRIFLISHRQMPSSDGWIETFEDITERRKAEEKIIYMARHDALTGLPNRMYFHEQFDKMVGAGSDNAACGNDGRGNEGRGHEGRSNGRFAVLCLDLDHFKAVNDTLGHQSGDQFLQIAAERIRGALRDTDLVARFGGDEFAILQRVEDQPAAATALAIRLIEIMQVPIVIGDHQMPVGVSVGISLAPADGIDASRLLNNADMALYRAKAEGRGAYRFFEPAMDTNTQARRMLEVDLRRAVTAGTFELHYQPIVKLESNEVLCFEALLRWPHPTRGMIPPLEFIPLAEETGLIVPLGEWVLREACAEAVKWQGGVHVAVNLSPVQFKSPGLVAAVAGALSASGLSPRRVELEITESVLLQDSDATVATLHQLRDLGVAIAMDDFGTGYSSLSYLRKFPFDKIKIGRSFTRDFAESNDSLAIIRAVVGLGSSLGIPTIAVGVETAEQLKRLKAEGCTEAQGFLFGAAKPAGEAIKHLTVARQLRVVA